MAKVLSELLDDLNIVDRYSVSQYLVTASYLIINEAESCLEDNGTQDMASRTIQDLKDSGVREDVISGAICIFYRDNSDTIDALRKIRDGEDYLTGLERFTQKTARISSQLSSLHQE